MGGTATGASCSVNRPSPGSRGDAHLVLAQPAQSGKLAIRPSGASNPTGAVRSPFRPPAGDLRSAAPPPSASQRNIVAKALQKAQHFRRQGQPEKAAAADEEALLQSPRDFSLRQLCIGDYRRLGNTVKLQQLYIEGVNLAQSEFERQLYQNALDRIR